MQAGDEATCVDMVETKSRFLCVMTGSCTECAFKFHHLLENRFS